MENQISVSGHFALHGDDGGGSWFFFLAACSNHLWRTRSFSSALENSKCCGVVLPSNRIETDVGLSAKISCTFSHGIDGWASPASILKYIMGTPRLRKTGQQKNRSTASPQTAQTHSLQNQPTLPSPTIGFRFAPEAMTAALRHHGLIPPRHLHSPFPRNAKTFSLIRQMEPESSGVPSSRSNEIGASVS